jgi:F0F1-type ATP synthase assembly protein I
LSIVGCFVGAYPRELAGERLRGTMATQEQMLAALDRSERRAARLRDQAKTAVEDAVATVATIGGGAVAGFLDARYYDTRPLGMGLPLLTGASATIVGLMGWAGRQSRFVGAVGSGLLTAETYKAVYQRSKPEGSSAGYMTGAAYPQQMQGTAPPMTMEQLIRSFQAHAR